MLGVDASPYRAAALTPPPDLSSGGEHREHPAFLVLLAGVGLIALGSDLARSGPLGVASVVGLAMMCLAVRTARPGPRRARASGGPFGPRASRRPRA